MSLMEEERFQNQNDERSNVCGSPHAEGAKIKKKYAIKGSLKDQNHFFKCFV